MPFSSTVPVAGAALDSDEQPAPEAVAAEEVDEAAVAPPPLDSDPPPSDDVSPAVPRLPALTTTMQPSAAAAASSSQEFAISTLPKKNANGTAQCMAVGCEKNAQGKTKINNVGPFCRFHFNAWLISTGQIESWDCLCGIKVSIEADRCGQCHRWQKGMRPPMVAGKRSTITSTATIKKERSSAAAATVPEDPSGNTTNIQISNLRRMSERGRTLCKVVGCVKLDQARNDGYCRKHFRMLSGGAKDNRTGSTTATIPAAAANTETLRSAAMAAVDESFEDWTCSCGKVISAKQKRCGKCNKVRLISPMQSVF
jgi:hypothetical protein